MQGFGSGATKGRKLCPGKWARRDIMKGPGPDFTRQSGKFLAKWSPRASQLGEETGSAFATVNQQRVTGGAAKRHNAAKLAGRCADEESKGAKLCPQGRFGSPNVSFAIVRLEVQKIKHTPAQVDAMRKLAHRRGSACQVVNIRMWSDAATEGLQVRVKNQTGNVHSNGA